MKSDPESENTVEVRVLGADYACIVRHENSDRRVVVSLESSKVQAAEIFAQPRILRGTRKEANMIFRMALVCSVLLSTLVVSATGEVLYTLESPNPEYQGYFGHPVSGAGDINNDGYDDIVVGAHNEDTGSTNAGRVYVISGQTGGVLLTLTSAAEDTDGRFGYSVSGAGDVNADGFPDLIVGAYQEDTDSVDAGRAYVFSGQSGSILYDLVSPEPKTEAYFGGAVSGAGDVNDDGYDDVIVGAGLHGPNYDYTGGESRAYVFNGQTGAILYALDSPGEGIMGSFGSLVSGAGDVNADGYDDVIIGAWMEYTSPSPAQAGRAYIFSGQTGDTLRTLVSPNEEGWGHFGCSVAGAGDVDGDGFDDVIVGADQEDTGVPYENAGRAYVFSGMTGETLHTLISPRQEYWGIFGFWVSGSGDVNNDGFDDVIVGAFNEDPYPSPSGAGRAYVFNGHTGEAIFTLVSPSEEPNGLFGVSVAHAGDIDGDSRPDVVVGAVTENGGAISAGRAYVFNPRLDMDGSISGNDLVLQWNECTGTIEYWVYGASNQAHFTPGLVDPWGHRLAVLPPETLTWSSASGVGDPENNWTYQVIAVDAIGLDMARSNRSGEYDFGWDIP